MFAWWDWQHAAQFGQFISGVSLALGSITAISLFVFVQKKQVQDSWSEAFREIYADFWSDPDCTEVRKWILNSAIYEAEFRAVFERRNSVGQLDCQVTREDHDKLEQLDRFCAFMMRALSFPRHRMSPHDQEIWEGFLDPRFWIRRIAQREAILTYVSTHWPKLDPKQLGIPSKSTT